jgi:ATP-binding cassette subfamily B protein/subfamily B ATP-binding cassette protein MsbA
MSQRPSPFHQIVFAHLHAARGDLVLGVLCLAGSSALALLEPWPFKIVIDYLLLAKPLPHRFAFLAGLLQAGAPTALIVLAVALVLIVLGTGSLAFGQQFITFRIGYQLVYRLRSELFDHLQRLPLSYHIQARWGETLSKVTADTTILRDMYTEYLLTLTRSVLLVLGMMAVMLMIDWRLALVILASFPLLAGTLYQVLRRVKVASGRQRRREGNIASRLAELLGSVSLVQAFGRERYERERFDEESARLTEDSIRAIRTERAGARLVNGITAVGSAVVLVVGGLRALYGHVTPGDLVVFLTYVRQMYTPVRTFARLSARLARASASVERINEILQTPADVQDVPDAIEARDLKGSISFEAVSFAYQPGTPVLDKVSFHIPSGTRVALVGASGAGKSTIANLLVRLYDVNEGRILIDGVDIRRYRRESLRRAVAVVFQNTLLVGTSVRENIAYGKPDATDEEIERAARQAHAHEFITALPNGYDEVLGEGGATLSGGQRQRLCLARAFIREPTILVLDEPTSAVDAESEVLIREALARVQAGKTLLTVAHQIRTVRDADLILVLKSGRIVEHGTHEELLARGGAYCELFRALLQDLGPLPEPEGAVRLQPVMQTAAVHKALRRT